MAMTQCRLISLHPQPAHRPKVQSTKRPQHPRLHLVVSASMNEQELPLSNPSEVFARKGWLSLDVWDDHFEARFAQLQNIQVIG